MKRVCKPFNIYLWILISIFIAFLLVFIINRRSINESFLGDPSKPLAIRYTSKDIYFNPALIVTQMDSETLAKYLASLKGVKIPKSIDGAGNPQLNMGDSFTNSATIQMGATTSPITRIEPFENFTFLDVEEKLRGTLIGTNTGMFDVNRGSIQLIIDSEEEYERDWKCLSNDTNLEVPARNETDCLEETKNVTRKEEVLVRTGNILMDTGRLEQEYPKYNGYRCLNPQLNMISIVNNKDECEFQKKIEDYTFPQKTFKNNRLMHTWRCRRPDGTFVDAKTKIDCLATKEGLTGNSVVTKDGPTESGPEPNEFKCFIRETGKILPTIVTKRDCLKPTDIIGRRTGPKVWDSPCMLNSDCPFFKKDAQPGEEDYGCKEKFCKMPPGIRRVGYKMYEPTTS